MRPHRARRERETAEDRETVASPAPPSPASAVLALQRSAGNAAVGGWLRASAPVLQRDKKVPDDADELADVGDALGSLQVDTDSVSESGRAGLFDGRDRLPARPGVTVQTHFGGTMAAAPTDEKKVRNGLGSLAMRMFGLDGEVKLKKGETPLWEAPKGGKPAKPRPPTGNLVREQDLTLSGYGGKDGRYRFTAVVGKGTAAKPSEVDLIVELIGAQRPAFKSWADLPADRRAALQKTFDGYGFTKREPKAAGILDEPEPIDDWVDDKWAWVLQAVELMPADTLSTLSGIAWQRGHPVPPHDKEDGFYETNTAMPAGGVPTRRLTLYDKAFSSQDRLLATVAHELGHAVSGKPAEHKGGKALDQDAGYVAAAKADGVPITKYGETSGAEAYAEAYSMFVAEPGTMKVLRPKTFAWFAKQQAGFAAARPKPAPGAAKPAKR